MKKKEKSPKKIKSKDSEVKTSEEVSVQDQRPQKPPVGK